MNKIIMWILILAICAVLFLIYIIKYGHYWKKRGVFQVNYVILKFIWNKRSISEIYKDIFDKYPHQSNIGIFLGSPVLLVKDIRDIQAILQNNFLNFVSRGIKTTPKDILGDNLLLIDDYFRWKLIRNKLSPIFTRMKLKNMYYIMDRCAQDFTQFIKETKCIQRDTYNSLYNYTTSCIAATLFGIDTTNKTTMNSPFLEMTRNATVPSLSSNVKSILSTMSPKLFYLLNIKFFGDHEDFFIGIVKKVLELRRHEQGVGKHQDFIDMCIELQDQGIMKDPATGYEMEATDEVLAAQAFFFFLAGVDTSATAMHFTLLELASNSDILKKVHDEIDKIFDESNQHLRYEDIEKLEYLDMVLSESMRKYPPIGLVPRLCTEATTLPSGIKLDKNTLIHVPVYTIHRDEKIFPNPTVFDPDRFSPKNISKITKFSYLPFGEGNRKCIGDRFARVQIKSCLAWLLRKYTLKYQKYEPVAFAHSFFSVKDEEVNFELVLRDL